MNRRLLGAIITAAVLIAACGEDDLDTGVDEVSVIDEDLEAVDLDEESDDAGDPETDDGNESDDAGSGSQQLDLGDATFYEVDCPFEIEIEIDVDCGIVEVPESRQGLSDATIELAIAILRTPSNDPAPDPVVFLAGGPGGVALAQHSGWLGGFEEWEYHAVLSTRDLILVDQRGVGYSQPSLRCDREEEDCFARLVDEGIAVAAYSTPENAADIAAMRTALGFDEWNLYGSSYGTRLALVVLRDHPQGVRSVVLEGVYPPDKVPAYHDYIGNTFGMLDALADECRRQPACDAAYGNIEDLLIAALEETQSGPSQYGAQDLFDTVFTAMYSMPGVSAVPLALWLAADGAIDEAIELLTGDDPGFSANRRHRWSTDPSEDSDGFFNSVECREEHAFTDLEVLDGQAEEYLEAGVNELLVAILLDGAKNQVESVCAIWDSGQAASAEREPAVSDVPTLLLSGGFDPITPSSWGDLAAASLSRSTHTVVPSLSHSLINVDQCIDDIVIDFLIDPTSPLATSCVAAMATTPFLVP